MTVLRRLWIFAPLAGVALLIVVPSLAIRNEIIPFEFRFATMLIVVAGCLAFCALAGLAADDLGLSTPWVGRHWIGCGLLTFLLCASIAAESTIVGPTSQPTRWLWFLPFYVLVSAPCQEVACRAIPKVLTERLELSGAAYVLYSATVFSLMHVAYGDWLLLLNTFVSGLVWAGAYLTTRNVWPLIASHAAVGAFAFAMGAA